MTLRLKSRRKVDGNMAIYFHDSEKLPVGVPVYGFAYRVDDDNFDVLIKCRPTLGVIEKCAKYSYSGKFIPEDKSKRWCNHNILIYSDNYDEAVEAYNRMVEERVKRLNEKIRVLQNEVAEANSHIIKKEEVNNE
jgi:hypothetical protein